VATKLFDGGLPKKGDVTLGIDQSLTGFALTVMSVEDPTKHLTWVYKSTYFGIERLVDIRTWLIDSMNYIEEELELDILDIAMEGTVLQSQAALVLGELSACVRLAIYDFFDDERKYPLKVPPMTLKKYAAGKGNAKKNEVVADEIDLFGERILRVRISQPPEDGKANKALIKLLAEYLQVKKNSLTIIAGEKSTHKIVEINFIK
jgi:uncharacterized protein (TIGR00251 family)